MSDLLAADSYNAFDLRALISSFVGSQDTYVLRGLDVISQNGLNIQINVADSLVFNPTDANGSFYLGLPTDAPLAVALPANQSLVYIEATFTNVSQSPVSRAAWDPLAQNGSSVGDEFSSAVNSQVVLNLSISVNTTGFSADAIPLATASTAVSSISSFVDNRPLLYRLGTGGSSPNQLNKFDWANARGEPVQSGSLVGNQAGSPWQVSDSTGILNDKGISTQKQWMDAVMTRLAEIAGQTIWYQSSSATAPVKNLSLNELYFDLIGSNIQPDPNASFIWTSAGGNLVLASQGLQPAVSPYTNALIRWQSNNTGLQWQIGGTFINGSRSYSYDRFQSPSPCDNGNLYLYLEREVSKGSGASVQWMNNSSYTSYPSINAVSGQPGDFVGIALGDYIRRQSEGYARYYQVTQMWNGTTNFTQTANPNYIADSTVKAVYLTNITNPALNIIGNPSTEPLIYFRANYSNADLFADTSPGVYSYQDANFSWLGRRLNNLFYLKGFGALQQGEEAPLLAAGASPVGSPGGSAGGGAPDLTITHPRQSYYDPTNGYALKSGSGTLLTINRRARNNTVPYPGPTDNSGSLLTYTINAPVGLLTTGQSLWVRLSDTTSGVLTNGSVTDTPSDLDNQDDVTNRWQIVNGTSAPLRTFDDKDVFLLAYYTVLDGNEVILFFDGSIVGPWGRQFDNNVELIGDVKLTEQGTTSVLFIDNAISGKVASDPTNLWYNNSTDIFGFVNFRAQNSNLFLGTPTNTGLLTNLGAFTATIGAPSSTIYIPGVLNVAGNIVAAQTSVVFAEEKVMTLGVGDLVNGGYDAGIEVADDTRSATSLSTVASSPNVAIVLSTTPPYVVGNIIGIDTQDNIGGLTSGEISGKYTMVSSLTAPGQVTLSGSTLTIQTAANATATATQSTTTTQSFMTQWSFKVTDSSGNLNGYTSWAFQVKNISTTPTLTPVTSYGIVPTANSADMIYNRIPFVNHDARGPAGVDTTLDFSPNFTWNNSTQSFTVNGSVAGFTMLDWAQQSVYEPQPTTGYTRVWAENDYLMYQRSPDGNIQTLTNQNGDVFNEIVAVVSSPSGNNQTAVISSPPQSVVIPKDTKKFIGSGLTATTDGTTATVTVKKINHGLSTGELVTISASSPIGGISPVNLSVTNVACTVIDSQTFSFQALLASTSVASGNLDKVVAVSTRSYVVGDDSLEVWLNNVKLTKGDDYNEVGSVGMASNTISVLIDLNLGDVLIYRIDSNGGLVVINNSGGTSLQAAYTVGNSITTISGVPFTVNGPAGQNIAVFNGNIQVTGVIN